MRPETRTLRLFQTLTALLAVATLLLSAFSLRLCRDFRDSLAWEVQNDIIDLNYTIKGYFNTAGTEAAIPLSQVRRSATVLSTRLDMLARHSSPPPRENSPSALGLTQDQLWELQSFFCAFETYLGEGATPPDPAFGDSLWGMRVLLESYVIGKDPADYAGLLHQAGEDPESVDITFWPVEGK